MSKTLGKCLSARDIRKENIKIDIKKLNVNTRKKKDTRNNNNKNHNIKLSGTKTAIYNSKNTRKILCENEYENSQSKEYYAKSMIKTNRSESATSNINDKTCTKLTKKPCREALSIMKAKVQSIIIKCKEREQKLIKINRKLADENKLLKRIILKKLG